MANNLAVLKSEYPSSPNDLGKALELAKLAYRLNPEQAQTADTLGWIYFKTGDLQRALPLLEQAVVMTPGSAIVNYHLGVVLFNKVDKEAAKERLRKAVESSEEFNGRDEALQTIERLS